MELPVITTFVVSPVVLSVKFSFVHAAIDKMVLMISKNLVFIPILFYIICVSI